MKACHLKGILQPKKRKTKQNKNVSSFIHLHVSPNLYDCIDIFRTKTRFVVFYRRKKDRFGTTWRWVNDDRIFHFWLSCPCKRTCRAGWSETGSSCMQFYWTIKSNVQLILQFSVFNFNVFILTLKMWIKQKQPNETSVSNTVFKSHEQPIYKYRHRQDFISFKTKKGWFYSILHYFPSPLAFLCFCDIIL